MVQELVKAIITHKQQSVKNNESKKQTWGDASLSSCYQPCKILWGTMVTPFFTVLSWENISLCSAHTFTIVCYWSETDRRRRKKTIEKRLCVYLFLTDNITFIDKKLIFFITYFRRTYTRNYFDSEIVVGLKEWYHIVVVISLVMMVVDCHQLPPSRLL